MSCVEWIDDDVACLLDSCCSCVECCVEWDGVVLRMSLYWVDSECKFSTAYARGCHAKTFGSFGGILYTPTGLIGWTGD